MLDAGGEEGDLGGRVVNEGLVIERVCERGDEL